MLQRLAHTAAEQGNLDRLRDLLQAAQAIADELDHAPLVEACARLRR